MKFLLTALFFALIVATSGCSGSSEPENVPENAPSDNQQISVSQNVQKPSGLRWKKQTFKAENCDVPSTDEMEYM
ncbi:MAG: hypothetical protein ACKO5L_00170, partial [Bacteroidota bacterium]